MIPISPALDNFSFFLYVACQFYDPFEEDSMNDDRRKRKMIAMAICSVLGILPAWLFYTADQVIMAMGFIGIPLSLLFFALVPQSEEYWEEKIRELSEMEEGGSMGGWSIAFFRLVYILDPGRARTKTTRWTFRIVGVTATVLLAISMFGAESWWFEKKMQLIITGITFAIVGIISLIIFIPNWLRRREFARRRAAREQVES